MTASTVHWSVIFLSTHDANWQVLLTPILALKDDDQPLMSKAMIQDTVILLEVYDLEKIFPQILKLVGKSWARVWEVNSFSGKKDNKNGHLISLGAKELDRNSSNLDIVMQRKIGETKALEKKNNLGFCPMNKYLPSTFFLRFFGRVQKIKTLAAPMHILSLTPQHGAIIYGFLDWLGLCSAAEQTELPEFRLYDFYFYFLKNCVPCKTLLFYCRTNGIA